LIFDHFVDDHTSRSTGTWPLALIDLINEHSTPNLTRTVAKRKAVDVDGTSMEDKRKIALGNKLKSIAMEVRKYVQQFYNKAWVTELPSGYNHCQFLEALRQTMIPCVLHRNAIKSSRSLKDDRKARSAKIDILYNNALKAVDRKGFLPFGWIAWVLGGWPRGEKRALKILMLGQEINRNKSSFSSRAVRRAERTSGAQIGRAAIPVNAPLEVPEVKEAPVELLHRLIMSVDSDPNDKRFKAFKERLALEEKILANYEKFGWDQSRPEEYRKLQMESFEFQVQYLSFLRRSMDAEFNENDHSRSQYSGNSGDLTHSSRNYEESRSSSSASRRETPLPSSNNQLRFSGGTDITPPATNSDPTQIDEPLVTTESDLFTDISEEYLQECIRVQGVIAKVNAFEEDYDDIDDNLSTKPFKCQHRTCNKDVYDKCVMCRGGYEFCVDHFYHCYHEHDIAKLQSKLH